MHVNVEGKPTEPAPKIHAWLLVKARKPRSQTDRHMARQAMELIQAKDNILARLPVTRDGVQVIPMTDFVWGKSIRSGAIIQMTVWGNGRCAPRANASHDVYLVSDCYSTEEALIEDLGEEVADA